LHMYLPYERHEKYECTKMMAGLCLAETFMEHSADSFSG
jgi:hypothetical protein